MKKEITAVSFLRRQEKLKKRRIILAKIVEREIRKATGEPAILHHPTPHQRWKVGWVFRRIGK